MDVLGICANMVKALRYWLQTVGLTYEPAKGKRIQNFTELGKMVFEHDTYIEELGTLYLLQYCLASQKEEATAWYFFFNEFSMSEFSREDFVDALQKYIKMQADENDYAIASSEGYHSQVFPLLSVIKTWVSASYATPSRFAKSSTGSPLSDR